MEQQNQVQAILLPKIRSGSSVQQDTLKHQNKSDSKSSLHFALAEDSIQQNSLSDQSPEFQNLRARFQSSQEDQNLRDNSQLQSHQQIKMLKNSNDSPLPHNSSLQTLKKKRKQIQSSQTQFSGNSGIMAPAVHSERKKQPPATNIQHVKDISRLANFDFVDNLVSVQRLHRMEERLHDRKFPSLLNREAQQQHQQQSEQQSVQLRVKRSQSQQPLARAASFQKPFRLTQIADTLNSSYNELQTNNFHSFLRRTNEQILQRDVAEYQQPSQPFKLRFIKQLPVKQQDMVFNVQNLLRMKKIRENQLSAEIVRPDQLVDYVKKRNQVEMILQNSKKIKGVSHIAEIVEGEINRQEERINGIINQLLSKFDVYKK